MNRAHHETPSPLSSPSGWITSLVSQVERAFANQTSGFGGSARTTPAFEGCVPGGPRVLVVDDNPSNLDYAIELLRCWGITPVVAADGAEAVVVAAVQDFDLILMDLQMPVLDGLSATKQIRAQERAARPARATILAYTSHAPSQQLLRDCGIDGVLEKPPCAETLHECLLRCCASNGVARPRA